MRNSTKTLLIVVLGLLAAAILVFGGVLLGMNPRVEGALKDSLPSGWSFSGGDGYGLQDEVLRKLSSHYYEEVDEGELKKKAIEGMVNGLDDPYTVYMDPVGYADFLERSSGSYSGVGMTVEMKDRLVTIVSTFKGTPAEIAGMRAGDVILEVDGVSTEGLDLDEVVGRIKGPEGTQVMLKVYRVSTSSASSTTTTAGYIDGDDGDGGSSTTTTTEEGSNTADISHLSPGGEAKEFRLTRKTIDIPTTERELLRVDGKKIAHISLFTFSDGSASALREEVRAAVESERVDAVILDLRSNGGGLLSEAIDVASIFIKEGVIVTTEGLHSRKEVYRATGGAYSEVELIVLVDPYTASASEIVSGALQDEGRAVLVGETTFGKGLVQSIESLSNGGALKVTTAVYLTPSGRDINDKGIAPDVVAPDDPETEDVDECLEAALGLLDGWSGSR
jgi:carboxyl-terminal processing protease